VTTRRFIWLPPLEGHTDPRVNIAVKAGTVLTNSARPPSCPSRYIEKGLALGPACMSGGGTISVPTTNQC
jgi:hypothetical protein